MRYSDRASLLFRVYTSGCLPIVPELIQALNLLSPLQALACNRFKWNLIHNQSRPSSRLLSRISSPNSQYRRQGIHWGWFWQRLASKVAMSRFIVYRYSCSSVPEIRAFCLQNWTLPCFSSFSCHSSSALACLSSAVSLTETHKGPLKPKMIFML